MAKPKAFATRALFPEAREILDVHFETDYWTQPGGIPRAELLKRAADCEALVCVITERVDEELLAAAPKLRIVATVSVGYDHIDVAACMRRGIVVTNTPGVLDDTTADLSWALLMAVARRVVEGDAWVRFGTWNGWDLDQLVGGDVHGKTLGIIGFGRIGQRMARRALGFDMRVFYASRRRAPTEVENALRAELVSMDRLLAESDFVSLHVPLLSETRHLINTASFSKMKRTAYLINTTRGPVVDEAALVEALKAGQIAGAGLDVYEHEPKVHPGLLPLKNVVLTPHVGSASVETRTKMAVMAAENVAALFAGKRPMNALNPEVIHV
ncbi:MAG TPA: D-glycerate dehydrogenase [Candidatus Acidoferrales bacterium]|nr:D-glycerate dehydrogenase [Candidatus Acidoferrales bacterium]